MKLSNVSNSNTLFYLEKSISDKCYRCLGENIHNGICYDCGNKGTPLYFNERLIENKKHSLVMQFSLSEEQERASKFFLNKYLNKENATLNSVCGSGKTEIMYESILYCLNEYKKPLIAIPRKEIVFELYQRLKNVFPDTTIKYLDGLHHDDNGELIISTINQLVNYEDEFDLVVLDEMDAFPLKGSEYLGRYLKKCIKKNGVLFKMSATITTIEKNVFTLKRRYHNHDLAMPIFIQTKAPNLDVSHPFNNIIKSNKNRKFLIYTSSIKKSKELAEFLHTKEVNSKTENAKEIINDFKKNDDQMLVTTTILERGITIPNLDVIVLEADDDVFNYSTLIQIAGRVGRSINDPTGNIYFYYKNNKVKFQAVKNYIKRMNS